MNIATVSRYKNFQAYVNGLFFKKIQGQKELKKHCQQS